MALRSFHCKYFRLSFRYYHLPPRHYHAIIFICRHLFARAVIIDGAWWPLISIQYFTRGHNNNITNPMRNKRRAGRQQHQRTNRMEQEWTPLLSNECQWMQILNETRSNGKQMVFVGQNEQQRMDGMNNILHGEQVRHRVTVRQQMRVRMNNNKWSNQPGDNTECHLPNVNV